MAESNRTYTVVVSPRAAEMLLEHVRFAAQVSSQGVDNLRVQIIEAARSLAQFPERHPWLADPMLPAHKYRKMVINKRYILVYQIKDTTVHIDYVTDCRREYQWLL
ncbi:MAG: type II toxin-antitoxin system RelE/ParE family toxin [Bacillota bacterium]|nr:type II toxin-antitoxin system RelE/ParE family toxin [Bacillota bacterium]